MADLFDSAQAKRLFGQIGPSNLLPVSAVKTTSMTKMWAIVLSTLPFGRGTLFHLVWGKTFAERTFEADTADWGNSS